MTFRILLFFILMIGLIGPVSAQLEEDEFHYGFNAGVTYSQIDDIATTLIRPVFPIETYNTSVENRIGASVGFFLYHRFRFSKLAIQPEISYAMYGGDFKYDDINELQYTLAFKYQYFNIATLLKVYPYEGLFIGLGPQVGLNLDKSNLEYVSNQPELGPDLQIEQSLQEVLKGSADFSAVVALGYELPMGLMVEARFKYGVSDVIETLSNGFNFIENDNQNTAFQLMVGYAIPFFE